MYDLHHEKLTTAILWLLLQKLYRFLLDIAEPSGGAAPTSFYPYNI